MLKSIEKRGEEIIPIASRFIYYCENNNSLKILISDLKKLCENSLIAKIINHCLKHCNLPNIILEEIIIIYIEEKNINDILDTLIDNPKLIEKANIFFKNYLIQEKDILSSSQSLNYCLFRDLQEKK